MLVGVGCYEHMSSPHTYPPIYTFGNMDLGFQLFYCSRLPFRPLPLQTIRFLKQNRSTVVVSSARFTWIVLKYVPRTCYMDP
jgi:hypothetical protein